MQQTSASAQSVDDFKTQTEQSLTNLINGIEGVGNASVLVTIEKSSEQCMQLKKKQVRKHSKNKIQAVQPKNQSNNVMENQISGD